MQQLKIIGNNAPCPRGGSNFFQYDKGKYLVIGGVNRQPNQLNELADFWTLHLPHQDGNLAGIWQEIKFENQELYTSRSSQAACQDDGNNIYIFGGQKFLNGQSTDEFFCLNLNKKCITIQEQKKFRPKGRNSHSMSYWNNKIYMFAGANEDGPLDDLLVYDLVSQEWNKIDIQDQIIGREMHTTHIVQMIVENKKKVIKEEIKVIDLDIVQDEEQNEQPNNTKIQQLEVPIQQEQLQILENQENNKKQNYLIIIGGRYKNQILKDIQLIDLNTYQVIQLDNLGFPLCAHTSLMYNNEIYIFGGFNGQELNENIIQITNEKVISKGKIKVPLMASCALYSQDISKIVVFGGCNLEKDFNLVYVIAL